MDEAERCHEIAYIAYGVLLAHGPVAEVVAGSHLLTYTVRAPDAESLARLAQELGGLSGIDMIAPFGNSLHVSGRDAAALETVVAAFSNRPGLVWLRSAPSLEDVFIDLMSEAKDNYQ
jgi:ABC-2 type transport system ATP-binding protein